MGKGQSSAQIVRTGKALSHPLRIDILEAVGGGDLSPVNFHRSTGTALGNCAYHFKSLRKLGALSVADQVQRRGAMENRYVATPEGKALQRLIGDLRAG